MNLYFSIFLCFFGLVSSILNFILYFKVKNTCNDNLPIKTINMGQLVLGIFMFLIGGFLLINNDNKQSGFAFG